MAARSHTESPVVAWFSTVMGNQCENVGGTTFKTASSGLTTGTPCPSNRQRYAFTFKGGPTKFHKENVVWIVEVGDTGIKFRNCWDVLRSNDHRTCIAPSAGLLDRKQGVSIELVVAVPMQIHVSRVSLVDDVFSKRSHLCPTTEGFYVTAPNEAVEIESRKVNDTPAPFESQTKVIAERLA
ncbi:hypothetical protein Q31b_33750 [Novipirellula aureliae]|uniref:Uncharacterized protein n=1 Tax=Novipirellula aureliae TaxID=2527966 RepID=A0A5C6DXB7_9BACT|nr:hypothetical protein [Novipirellula aureliae]TWU40031.1 hypothetical protein Q31b_33750 [Novipirellula aureliae]